MRIAGRKFAITGAGRGLGATLAVVMADTGADVVLLARRRDALDDTASVIEARVGRRPKTLVCDLGDVKSCTEAGEQLSKDHRDLDGIIHNAAMWLPGSMADLTDAGIHQCITSAADGVLIITRRVLPVLNSRPGADIHVVVSTSGLPYAALQGASVAFAAAKSAQAGIVQGLSDELRGTRIRVTAVYPGNFEDVSPLEPGWNDSRGPGDPLTNREVIDAILFTLNLPPNATVKTLVIERGAADAHQIV